MKYLLIFLSTKLTTTLALRRNLAALGPDIVHLNNGLASDLPGIVAARLCRVPIICHVRAFELYASPHIVASRCVTKFLCVSGAIRDHLVGWGVEAERAVICHDSVNLDRFHKLKLDRASLLAQFGWQASDKVFGVIGRLDSWKGHDFFIQAIADARRDDPAIRGLIVGEMTPAARNVSYVARLRSLLERLQLEESVIFAGHRTDIPELLQGLHAVICSSSKPEPFGLMVVESMAVGTPVIATNAGGPAEMITDNENGLLIPLRDAPAMAQAMLRIASDETLATNLAAAGLLTVATRFTVERHVNRICHFYETALTQRVS